MAKILVVDDNSQIRRAVIKFLEKLNHTVSDARNGAEAMEFAASGKLDLAISDLRMPEMDGIQFLTALAKKEIELPVILLTGHGSVDSAVEAMKLGAADYLSKPVQFDELEVKIDRILEHNSLKLENERLKEALDTSYSLDRIIGTSVPMIQMKERIKPLANDRNISVLIQGETGTGKELVARVLHFGGPRRIGPFVAINCAALPENIVESELFGHEKGSFTDAGEQKQGLFEQANGGTFFLDEIDSLSSNIQTKLLRAIESRSIRRVGGSAEIELDVRFVFATGSDLEAAVEKGDFRRDLYFRIAVARIEVPALRDRPGDLPLLLKHFVKKFGEARDRKLRFEDAAVNYLATLDWKGNVRELENLVELLSVLTPNSLVTVSDIKSSTAGKQKAQIPENVSSNLKEATKHLIEDFEKGFIAESLERNKWNVSQTAAEIGLSRVSLHAKIKQYGLTQ